MSLLTPYVRISALVNKTFSPWTFFQNRHIRKDPNTSNWVKRGHFGPNNHNFGKISSKISLKITWKLVFGFRNALKIKNSTYCILPFQLLYNTVIWLTWKWNVYLDMSLLTPYVRISALVNKTFPSETFFQFVLLPKY